MAAIIWSDVVALVPPAAGLTSISAQNEILADANTALNVRVWGGEESPKLRLGRIFYAGHFGTLAAEMEQQADAEESGGATVGPISSKTVSKDSVSVSYGAASSSSGTARTPRALEDMSTTVAGQEYDRLVKTLVGARLPFATGRVT